VVVERAGGEEREGAGVDQGLSGCGVVVAQVQGTAADGDSAVVGVAAGERPGACAVFEDVDGRAAGAVEDRAADFAVARAVEVDVAQACDDAGGVGDVAGDGELSGGGLNGVLGAAGVVDDGPGQGVVAADVEDVGCGGGRALACVEAHGFGDDGDVAGQLESAGAADVAGDEGRAAGAAGGAELPEGVRG